MSREDIEDHIESVVDGEGDAPISEPPTVTNKHGMHEIVCSECDTVNGREPAPVTAGTVATSCASCGEVATHDYVLDGEPTEMDHDTDYTFQQCPSCDGELRYCSMMGDVECADCGEEFTHEIRNGHRHLLWSFEDGYQLDEVVQKHDTAENQLEDS